MSSRLQLRVSPGAASDGVVGRYGSAWKVRVSRPPEDGKANAAVLRLLADTMAVRPGDVAIVAGHGSRDKTITVEGIDSDEVERRLTLAAAARDS